MVDRGEKFMRWLGRLSFELRLIHKVSPEMTGVFKAVEKYRDKWYGNEHLLNTMWFFKVDLSHWGLFKTFVEDDPTKDQDMAKFFDWHESDKYWFSPKVEEDARMVFAFRINGIELIPILTTIAQWNIRFGGRNKTNQIGTNRMYHTFNKYSKVGDVVQDSLYYIIHFDDNDNFI